jgi:hypothetical protein
MANWVAGSVAGYLALLSISVDIDTVPTSPFLHLDIYYRNVLDLGEVRLHGLRGGLVVLSTIKIYRIGFA